MKIVIPGGSGQVDNMKACIELEHTTWKINQTSQSYSPTDANVGAAGEFTRGFVESAGIHPLKSLAAGG